MAVEKPKRRGRPKKEVNKNIPNDSFDLYKSNNVGFPPLVLETGKVVNPPKEKRKYRKKEDKLKDKEKVFVLKEEDVVGEHPPPSDIVGVEESPEKPQE